MRSIAEICNGAKRIAISGHIRPDGDCVGSTLALYNYIKKILPGTVVKLFLQPPAEIFSYLGGFEEIDSSYEDQEPFDVFFALDCSDKERLGDSVKYYEQAGITVCIDHHISNQGLGKESQIVPTASSTSELIFNLIPDKELDLEIAKALYTGIIHDTGVFQYSNTAPSTFMAAARLIQFGFDFSEIIDQTFYQKTYVQNQILGRTLLESILFMDGRCIVGVVDKKTMDFYHVNPKDLDGIVNQLRITKGVDCAVFLYESGLLEYKVSMRSNDKVDVAAVASIFGGGGHKKAAGCTMNGTPYDVINNLSEHIEKQLMDTAL